MTNLAKKLLYKEGHSLMVAGAPGGYVDRAFPGPGQIERHLPTTGRFDLVQVFVRGRDDLEAKRHAATQAVKPGGLLWITYPKQGGAIKTDINRDRTRELMEPTGWQPVTQISIDETWSALRFRPAAEVGKR